MDTPETVKPGSPVEAFGREASAANSRLVAGRRVLLEKDVSERDRFGRLLRDVWVSAGGTTISVGYELVALGFATVTTFPPDVKYVEQLLAAQRWARETGAGLWASEPTSAGPSPSIGLRPVGLVATCSAAYPDRCIPPPPPDLDCADIGHRVRVLPPDPHGLDGDHDGIGCERYPP
jgi:micrococcal nuclease